MKSPARKSNSLKSLNSLNSLKKLSALKRRMDDHKSAGEAKPADEADRRKGQESTGMNDAAAVAAGAGVGVVAAPAGNAQKTLVSSQGEAPSLSSSPSPSEKQLATLLLSEIYSIEQPRTVFEGIDELASSMKEVGQLQPIVVNPDGKGKYVIEQGERRWRAAKVAGFRTIDAVVNPETKHKNNADRIIRQLAENVQRDNMKLFELVRSVHAVIEMGMKGRALAARLGMNENDISALNSCAELPPVLDSLLVGMHIQDVKALRRLKSIYAEGPEKAQAVERQIAAWREEYETLSSPEEKREKRFVVTRAQVNAFDRIMKAPQTEKTWDNREIADGAPLAETGAEDESKLVAGKKYDPGHTSTPGAGGLEVSGSTETGEGGEAPVGTNSAGTVEAGEENPTPNKQEEPVPVKGKEETSHPSEKTQAAAPREAVDVVVYVMDKGPGILNLQAVPPEGTVFVRMDGADDTIEIDPARVRLIGVRKRR